MQLSLSVILLLRNREPAMTQMVRRAVDVVRSLAAKGRPFELLAVDQTSVDNTLSLLSVLHARIPELRILQDVRQGMAVIEAARAARGDRWLLVDRVVDPQLMTWGLNQLESGKRAAIVPGRSSRSRPSSARRCSATSPAGSFRPSRPSNTSSRRGPAGGVEPRARPRRRRTRRAVRAPAPGLGRFEPARPPARDLSSPAAIVPRWPPSSPSSRSRLIIVHEFGHYICAVATGMKVDRFSVFGIGPVVARLGVWRGTEFVISAIPFGAYVHIVGMEADDAPRSRWPRAVAPARSPSTTRTIPPFIATAPSGPACSPSSAVRWPTTSPRWCSASSP
ncbi:site-2 protease family protein [Nannocystis pusilla]|uniref:site-2 protease family protein n=1 Tax=Nannocystis pusilla TaxID=889268 RepID=UPI003B7DF036